MRFDTGLRHNAEKCKVASPVRRSAPSYLLRVGFHVIYEIRHRLKWRIACHHNGTVGFHSIDNRGKRFPCVIRALAGVGHVQRLVLP